MNQLSMLQLIEYDRSATHLVLDKLLSLLPLAASLARYRSAFCPNHGLIVSLGLVA